MRVGRIRLGRAHMMPKLNLQTGVIKGPKQAIMDWPKPSLMGFGKPMGFFDRPFLIVFSRSTLLRETQPTGSSTSEQK